MSGGRRRGIQFVVEDLDARCGGTIIFPRHWGGEAVRVGNVVDGMNPEVVRGGRIAEGADAVGDEGAGETGEFESFAFPCLLTPVIRQAPLGIRYLL